MTIWCKQTVSCYQQAISRVSCLVGGYPRNGYESKLSHQGAIRRFSVLISMQAHLFCLPILDTHAQKSRSPVPSTPSPVHHNGLTVEAKKTAPGRVSSLRGSSEVLMCRHFDLWPEVFDLSASLPAKDAADIADKATGDGRKGRRKPGGHAVN